MNLIQYKDMCTITSGTEHTEKSEKEIIEKCLKNCDELIKSIEEFKAYIKGVNIDEKH